MPRSRRLSTAGWLATAPVAGVAAARLAGYDRHPALSMANAGTQFVYLPAWFGLAAGLSTRRRVLTAVSAGVVAAHAAWAWPDVQRARDRRRAAAKRGRQVLAPDVPRLRVVTANVRYHSPDSTALGMELAGLGADVLLLQELDNDHLAMIKAAGAFDDFAYSYVSTRPGSFGAGIWSRYPLDDGETWEPAGLPMVRAAVTVAGIRVHVFNVHLKAPMRRRWIPVWKTQLLALEEEVRAAARRGPVLLAGDFNSTTGHVPFRRLLGRARLREAHIEAGRPFATTWPASGWLLPCLFRIDHVLVGDGFDVLAAREGTGPGSDHRPVVADLAVTAVTAAPTARAGEASAGS